ncbi:MAG: GNAT family N-acetyltransferase [Chthoniobacterales bacterium]|nr:GNAT family N-acetyltransferase [Chthoniobacterales bacterium]
MKPVRWLRFNWDLERLPASEIALPAHYHFGSATAADENELRTVITRSFAHDTSWGDAIHEVNGMIDAWLGKAFEPEGAAVRCLALRHGLRIIGAAVLNPDSLVEDNLSPGPCVLMEYRNRGLGTALLGESLGQLREGGLTRASARAKKDSPVAKFLYPKFNGTPTPDDTSLIAV